MTSPAVLHRLQYLSALVAGAALTTGCSDGGSSSTPPPPPPPAASLTLQGTAATGAAIAGAAVTAKCNGGTGSATTAANGSYSIALTAGVLPCALKVAASSGDLYSAVAGSGATATANLTPITQLIVASLAGKDPADYFTGFAAPDITALTSTALDSAQGKIVAVLKSNGVDASALGNLVTGNLTAASGSTAGNAYDQLLDALKVKLSSASVTLPQLTATVLQTTPTAAPSGTASVAADVALQAQATTCAALRSGTYRLVVPTVGADGSFGAESTEKLTINATVPAITVAAGETITLSPLAGSPCRFSTSGGGDIVVSGSGVFAMRTGDGYFGVGFPEQAFALADLAGDWNFLGYDRSTQTDPLAPQSLTVTISSAGVVAFTSLCENAKTCSTTGLPSPPLTINATGGFDINFSATEKSRLFAFRAGGGEMMLVGVGQDGTWSFGTRRRTNPQPTVGATNLSWSVNAGNALAGSIYTQIGQPTTESSNTITGVDTVNDAYTRNNVTNFNSVPVITRPETIFNNAVAGTARQGYRWRRPDTGVTNSAGATVNVSEFVALPLRGIGINAVALPNPNPAASQFVLSVAKP